MSSYLHSLVNKQQKGLSKVKLYIQNWFVHKIFLLFTLEFKLNFFHTCFMDRCGLYFNQLFQSVERVFQQLNNGCLTMFWMFIFSHNTKIGLV